MNSHGTRTKYNYHGCRCDECKAANRIYTSARRNTHPNALVSAKAAKKHLRKLQRGDVGLRAVRDVTGLSCSRLGDVRRGHAHRVTRSTERLILSVTPEAYSGGARVSGKQTLRLIQKLRDEGFTYQRLATQLNLWPKTLQRIVNRKGNVLADTQMRVERFYNLIMLEAA